MFFDWQTGIALLIVLGAVYFLGRKTVQFVQRLQSGSGCPSDCGGCNPQTNGNPQQASNSLVNLELPHKGKPSSS